MVTIEKRVWPEYFEQILSGDKHFELRLANFDCQPGDILSLKEWDPQTQQYTGRSITKEAGFIFKTKDAHFWSQEEIDKYGFQIISFK